ncbi:MAG: sulfotransferase family protein [Chloroflexota bacterium]
MRIIPARLTWIVYSPPKRKVLSLVSRINPAPVVLLGNQKSGTTAIAVLLAKYTRLSVTNDMPSIFEPVQTMLHSGELTMDEFVRRNRYDWSNDIVKEPSLTFLYPQVKAAFPRARFAMIVRDPRANIRSLLNRKKIPGNLTGLDLQGVSGMTTEWERILDNRWMGLSGDTYIESLAHRWNRAASVYLDNADRMILLRYEDFMADKAGAVAALARQLGLGGKRDVSSEVDVQYQMAGDRRIGWSEFFGADNLRRIETICAERMRELGYESTEREAVSTPLSERAVGREHRSDV